MLRLSTTAFELPDEDHGMEPHALGDLGVVSAVSGDVDGLGTMRQLLGLKAGISHNSRLSAPIVQACATRVGWGWS